jgi:hypothetical protein
MFQTKFGGCANLVTNKVVEHTSPFTYWKGMSKNSRKALPVKEL